MVSNLVSDPEVASSSPGPSTKLVGTSPVTFQVKCAQGADKSCVWWRREPKAFFGRGRDVVYQDTQTAPDIKSLWDAHIQHMHNRMVHPSHRLRINLIQFYIRVPSLDECR